jgi:RNA polymerase sigma factor (sigma-70 family)
MTMQADKEAFLALIEKHKGIIFKICYIYCPKSEDRDDLAQEIVFNLWKAFPDFAPAAQFSTWMYRIALNVAISFFRKEKRAIRFSPYEKDLIVFEEDPATLAETEYQFQRLQQLIQELNEIDRSIMLLYLNDKTYQEIAGIMGISLTNVATKISRIRQKLKSKFYQ